MFVTLSEDSSSYAPASPRRSNLVSREHLLASDYAVQITQHYGPSYLTGAKTVRSETKADHFVPTIGAMGFEVGGMGHRSYTSKQRVGRWVFKGTVGRPRGCDGFRTLEWQLSENDLDPDQAHKQEYHTAFAFEHSQRPVFMRVEVEGKIRSKMRQLKHDLLRFSSQFGMKDDSTLTSMDFSKDDDFKKNLNHVAMGLDMAMQMENCQSPPLEVPDPTPAKFTQGTPRDTLTGITNQHRSAILNYTPPGLGQKPLLRGRRVSKGQGGEQEGATEVAKELEGGDDALLRRLKLSLHRRTGSGLAAHIRMEETKSQPPDSTDNSTTTAMNSDTSTHIHALETVEEDIRQIIVRFPVPLILLRYVATMMKWLAQLQSIPPAGKEWKPAPSLQRDEGIHDSSRLLKENASGRCDRDLGRPPSPVFELSPALTRDQFEARGE